MDGHKTSILTEDGVMTIMIDDRLLAQKSAGPTKPHATSKQQAPVQGKQRGTKQQVVVRAPTQAKAAKPWHGVQLEPGDAIFDQFATGCNLRSKATHKSYMRLLTVARRMCDGIKTEALIKNPAACIKKIESHATTYNLSPNSVTSYLGAVLSVIKHTIGCSSKEKLKGEINEWQQAHKKWQLLGAQPYLQNKASAKQSAAWIAYTDFCKVRDRLEAGSKSRLLLSLYSMIPPCRADLGACKVLTRPPTAKELTQYPGNYVCIPTQGSKAAAYLHLRQFKTARCFAPDGVRTALPDALVQEIRLSLANQARPWLFAQEHNINKPYSRSAFSTWADRQFQRTTGIADLNIQNIRHSYVTRAMEVNDTSTMDPCTQAGLIALCEKRLANIAKAMAHSIETQKRYRFKLTSSGEPQPVSKHIIPRQTGTDAEAMVVPAKPATASHGVTRSIANVSSQKSISLNDAVGRWRGLSDQQTIARLQKLLQQHASDLEGKPKPALSKSTLDEYAGSLRLLQARLAEDWTGQPRHALPSFIECLLRPNGPKFVAQFLADPAEGRRIAICMTSVVVRCFGNLNAADKQRAVTAWRSLLSDFRREYIQSRDRNGGFGGYVDEDQLLSALQIQAAIERLPMGSGERMILRFFQMLVGHFPAHCQVNAPLLNLGHIKIVTADAAPGLDVWAREVLANISRESGLLVLSNVDPPKLYLLFSADKDGPIATQYNLCGSLAAELHAYISKMPPGLTCLFPQVKGHARKASKAYEGPVGRDSFNARINRILSKVFGDAAITQTTFRLSIVNSQKKQSTLQSTSMAGSDAFACTSSESVQQSEKLPGSRKH